MPWSVPATYHAVDIASRRFVMLILLSPPCCALQPELPPEVEPCVGMEPTVTATGIDEPYDTSAVSPQYRREKIAPD